MSKIDAAITTLRRYNAPCAKPHFDVRVQLLVSVAMILAALTLPLDAPERVVWFFCFPVIMAEAQGIGYLKILKGSLYVLPIVVLIGVFNPLMVLVTIVLRGLFTVQVLLLLVQSNGFNEMCEALGRVGMPRVLVTQLQMLYRFLLVILEEAQNMHRARISRGFGRKSYPLKMWGTFVGQLLLRSVERARRINRAMSARGFNGEIPFSHHTFRLRSRDWLYLAGWCALCAFLRFYNPMSLLQYFCK